MLQVATLSQLADLRIVGFRGIMFNLPPSLSSLALGGGPLDCRWLSRQAQLHRLELLPCICSADVLGSAVGALRQLTHLAFFCMPPPYSGPPGTICGLINLRSMIVDCDNMLHRLPSLDPCAYLLYLAASLPTVACSEAALAVATRLEQLNVLHHRSAFKTPAWEEVEAGWRAVCRWAACHPCLSRLWLWIEHGAPPLPTFVHASMLELQQHRPQLAVRIVEIPPGVPVIKALRHQSPAVAAVVCAKCQVPFHHLLAPAPSFHCPFSQLPLRLMSSDGRPPLLQPLLLLGQHSLM